MCWEKAELGSTAVLGTPFLPGLGLTELVRHFPVRGQYLFVTRDVSFHAEGSTIL